jgi:hypothetical protein
VTRRISPRTRPADLAAGRTFPTAAPEAAMRKLSLQVEDLAVESFQTGDADVLAGTVEAREMVPTPPYFTCPPKTRPTDCPCTPMF